MCHIYYQDLFYFTHMNNIMKRKPECLYISLKRAFHYLQNYLLSMFTYVCTKSYKYLYVAMEPFKCLFLTV